MMFVNFSTNKKEQCFSIFKIYENARSIVKNSIRKWWHSVEMLNFFEQRIYNYNCYTFFIKPNGNLIEGT